MSSVKSWQRNLPVPFFSQRENKYVWQQTAIGGEEKSKTTVYTAGEKIGSPVHMADKSCNITSLCMIMNYLELTNETPDQMMKTAFEKLDWLHEANSQSGLTGACRPQNWVNLQKILSNIYKIPSHLITCNRAFTIKIVQDEIARGYPVMVSYGPTWYLQYKKDSAGNLVKDDKDKPIPINTDEEGSGHIAVIRGFTEKDDVIINDPWGDVTDPYGFLAPGDNDSVRKGIYYTNGVNRYYGFGTGDNCVLRLDELKKIMKDNGTRFHRALSIHYPHFWSFPVRNGAEKLRLTPGLNENTPEEPGKNLVRFFCIPDREFINSRAGLYLEKTAGDIIARNPLEAGDILKENPAINCALLISYKNDPGSLPRRQVLAERQWNKNRDSRRG